MRTEVKQGDHFGSYCKAWVTHNDGFQVERWAVETDERRNQGRIKICRQDQTARYEDGI